MEKRCPRRELELTRALIFASGEPVSLKDLAKVLALSEKEALQLVDLLKKKEEEKEGGIRILRLEDRYQMSTNPIYYPQIELLYKQQAEIRLTDVQLETLAIITYRQPVTRQEVSDIRGVASDAVISRLISLGLVEEAGRLKAPGRPVLLRTSDAFLKAFKLESVSDLPHLPETSVDVQTELDLDDTRETKEEAQE